MKRALLLLLTLLMLVLCGCAAVSSVGKAVGLLPLNPLSTLQIAAAADANAGSATAIDVVWVFNPTALAQMPKTGPQWFAGKAALLAGRSADLAVLPLQVPVGSAQQTLELPNTHRKAIAVLAYVNFLAEAGQPVATLTAFKCVRIELAAVSVSYVDCR